MWSRRWEGFQDAPSPAPAPYSASESDGPAPAPYSASESDGPAPAPYSASESDGPAPAPYSASESDGPAPAPYSASESDGPAPAPYTASAAPAPYSVSGTSSDRMSLTLLTNLKSNIDAEIIALNALPDSDTNVNVIAKINQLEQMKYDISQLTREIQNGQKRIEDVPFSVESAQAFLTSLGRANNSVSVYSDLFAAAAPPPTQSTGLGSAGGTDIGIGLESLNLEELQNMFKYLQDIKWRFELSYDPALSHKTDLLNRFESLERRIMQYSQTGTKMPDDVRKIFTQELNLLSQLLESSTKQKAPSYTPRMQGKSSRTSTTSNIRSDGRVYSDPDVHSGYGIFDGVPMDSPDVRIRPGFVMTDEQIRRRGSAAAFNTQAVGGADYKKRSEEICRHIRGANIGDPSDFGCIENPGEVSANYSWKGNYAMICSRLGDTWGSWYPAMFGCPKNDADDRYNGNLL